MSGPIVVVGDIVTDVLALTQGPLAHGSDTPATVTMLGGGGGANTAMWLASAGVPVRLVAAVGTDAMGSMRLAELEGAGVECVVRKTSARPTGSVVVLSDGVERTMLNDRGANLLVDPCDVDRALAGAVHLHLSGYVLLDNQSRSTGHHALRAAASAGLTTSVDAASAAPLRLVGAHAFLDWVRHVDVLLANLEEAAVLAEGSPADAAVLADELAKKLRRVVVKRGAAGAVWAEDGRIVEVDGMPVAVVDPTGAGDAFAAGAIAAWCAGAAPTDCLLAGAALGARAVSQAGARPTPT